MGGAISAGGAGELPDKNTAFLEFKKSNAGAKLTSFIKTSQEDVLVKKRRITEVGTTINQLKQHIDASSAELQRLRNERLSRGDDDVVDEQEFQLVAAVKETKGQYRSLYDELTSLKDKRDMAVRSIDAAKRQLVEDYESWYRQQCEQLGGGGTISSHHNSPSKHQWTSGAAALDDDLDEGERFEALELHRVMDDDPESVAFYTAKKVATTRLNQQAPVGGGRGGPTVGGGGNARARKH
ncbi:Hypothetical protein, putative [Bodo saltans]|uniref:Kinesin-like protein KIF6/9 C-terminal domain-containing protein n=1 Tax=Bodo saltans TaxID=75058 RepID=A0A0S4J934_BODSA|nr:Hypothetical protein, putative [Bodo saltans]|eukprot:CUG74180.1 Hypothetical protein, putative [Bodo saltans]